MLPLRLLLQVLLNVHSTKPSAKEAREEAATVAASVLSAVGSVNGISSSDVTTLDVSVHPQINWGEGGQQTIVGYQFNQRLQVKVQNLSNDALGAVVDAAVLAGGNNLSIDTIQAELSPALARQAQNTARAEAVEDGRAAAEVIAQAAGVRLGEILTCTEGSYSSGPGPMPAAFGRGKVMAAEAYTGTPVNVGPTTTTTSVVMEFFIMPVSK
ncbi:hypothetical protein N2152v2_003051 [Parachlorella kessleri]